MRKILLSTLVAIVALLLNSCNNTDLLRAFGPEDSTPPGVVTNVTWEATPGGAILSYTLPMDPDLSYVKAVYEVNGVTRDVIASQYNTSLTIDGLPNMDQRNVQIFCYDKMNNASAPYSVDIIPEESPVQVMRNSLEHEMGFGGFTVRYKNPSRAELTIEVSQFVEGFDDLRFYESRVFTQEQGEWQVINLPNKKNIFAIVIKDRHGNISDEYRFEDTPWREVYLDKGMFEYVGEPKVFDKDDWYQWGGRPSNVWDNNVGDWNFMQTGGDGSYPHYFHIDFGDKYPIGRILFQQRTGDSEIFATSCPRKFNVYGAAELPMRNSSDPLDGWIKLNNETFEVVRPSGRKPGEPVTEEDRIAAREGIMFTIDTEFPRPEIRYIKFEFTEGFQNNMVIVSEFSFWAQWR